MSGKNTTVYMTLQIKGNAGQEMKRIADQQVTATTKINQQWTQIGTAQARFVNTARAGAQATQNTARAGDQLLRTNKLIEGVLRNQTSQIKQHADYMKRVEQSSKNTKQNVQQTSSLWQKVTTAGGAVVGAGMALQQPIKRTVDYDRDLHYAAQKMSDAPSDWQATKKWMNTIIVGNAINGGVDRDTSFLAMDTLISNGAYNDNNLQKMKANLVKAHFEAAKSALASGGDIQDFARVGLAAKSRNLDEGKVQAMVIKADDLGAMSAKDLAKELPAQMGKLPIDKVNGNKQIAQLVALNEIAMNTAGTPSEAANNVNNMLSKMYSADTIKRLEKAHDINLPQRYAKGKDNGQTDFDVFSDVVDEIVKKDKSLQSVLTKLKNAKTNDEKKSILETKQAIFEQSGLAGILPDMQALMALVASKRYGGNWDSMTEAALTQGAQTRDLKYNYNKTELASVGVNAFDVTRKNSEYQTLQGTIGKLGEMGTKIAELTEKYPALITVMGTTELALKALAFSAGGAALAQVAGGLGKSGTVATGTATATTGVAAKAATGAKAMGLVGLAYAGAQVLEPIDNYFYSKVDKMFGGDGNRPDFLQQYIDKEKAKQSGVEQQAEKTEQLISEQQKQNELSQELSGKLSELINVTSQNKPLPFPSGSLLDMISQRASTEEKRTGAPNVPFYLQKH